VAKRRVNGEGTIYQRKDGRWEAAAYVLAPDGSRRRVRLYGSTWDEANQKRAGLIAKSLQGIPVESSDKVRDYLTYWLSAVAQPELRGRTFETYKRCVQRHIIPIIGNRRLHSLTPADVRDLLSRKLGEGLAPRTVQYIRAVLRSALSQAMRDGLVQRNVAALVRPPRAPRSEVTSLTFDEAKALLHHSRGTRLHAVWVVALSLGLRRSELLGLTWSNVDFDKGTLRVVRGLQRVAGALVLDELKSERSHRTLPLPKVTADALREHRTRQARDRLKAGAHWAANDLVFCTDYGTPVDPRNLNRSFRQLLIRANVRVKVSEDAHGGRRYTLLLRPESRLGARFRCCHRSVSPSRSPNPPCRSLGNGLSTASAIRRGMQLATGLGSCFLGRRSGRPLYASRCCSTRSRSLRSPNGRWPWSGGGGVVPSSSGAVPAAGGPTSTR
jgi:integrase